MTKSGLTDCNERRWNTLLEWLKGHGMMVDEDHLLVRPKHVAGTCLPSFVSLKVSQACSVLLGAGTGLVAIVDIPVRARICSIILDLLTTALFLLLSAVSDPVAYIAQQGQN